MGDNTHRSRNSSPNNPERQPRTEAQETREQQQSPSRHREFTPTSRTQEHQPMSVSDQLRQRAKQQDIQIFGLTGSSSSSELSSRDQEQHNIQDVIDECGKDIDRLLAEAGISSNGSKIEQEGKHKEVWKDNDNSQKSKKLENVETNNRDASTIGWEANAYIPKEMQTHDPIELAKRGKEIQQRWNKLKDAVARDAGQIKTPISIALKGLYMKVQLTKTQHLNKNGLKVIESVQIYNNLREIVCELDVIKDGFAGKPKSLPSEIEAQTQPEKYKEHALNKVFVQAKEHFSHLEVGNLAKDLQNLLS